MDQLTFKFPFTKKYYEQDYYVSSNNFTASKLIEIWPNWPGKWLNIFGESGSGKTHLSKILDKKIKKTMLIEAKNIDNKIIDELNQLECLIVDDFENNIDENLFYSILNQSKQLDNYLLINSITSIKSFNYKLKDLRSRINSFIFIGIELPTDDLLKVIIAKTLSDKQVSLSPKLTNFIIKNVERSYKKMFKFLKDVDELSLSTGKSININLIKKSIESMNKYRTHNCSELNQNDINKTVYLSGWLHRKRDHGNLLFIDLRDHYGITQCVIENNNKFFSQSLEKTKPESVLKINGEVVKRSSGTENLDLKTGKIEISIQSLEILSDAKELPMPVFGEQNYPEDIRLKYRFLDLRRDEMHNNIILRSKIISFIRAEMLKLGFLEYQTPILTSSSPEGARDFLVPSRLNPGKFYALPQAPQQFKQLIMVSGFDKYFQIAPCFRDEDARADRSPGEFYQLDLEMSFVEQEDVFNVVEKLLVKLFKQFSSKKIVNENFPRIKYQDAMLRYGTDKPDLRNPLIIHDLTSLFTREDVKFEIFKKLVKSGSIVRAIITKNTKEKPRSFFDNIDKWAKEQGASGLAYFTLEKDKEIKGKGPIGKFFNEDALKELMKISNAKIGDSIFLACGKEKEIEKLLSVARDKIANDLEIIKKDQFSFCWIVDYPMYEYDENSKKIIFSHNPFSMPQGNLKDLNFENPLEIKAYQYDIVCNGIELSSGAIRNHIPELMYKLFSIAGYTRKDVDIKFSGMINALSYGAPPHGGIAPGLDRIVMLLAEKENIREITLFPMNQNAQDLMMQAPSEIDEKQLKELGLKKDIKKELVFSFKIYSNIR